MGFCKRIGDICQERNISIKKVARLAEVPYTSLYSAIKRDSASMDIEALRRVAAVLGMSTTDLINQDNQAETNKALPDPDKASSGTSVEDAFLSVAKLKGFNIQPVEDGYMMVAGDVMSILSADDLASMSESMGDLVELLCSKRIRKK